MPSCREWLDDVRLHKEDERWMDQHGDDILAAIRSCLAVSHQFEDGVDLLMAVFSYYALYRVACTPCWISLLIDALLLAQERQDVEIETQLLAYVADGRMSQGDHETAYVTYNYVIEQAQAKANHDLELGAYTGLFWLQAVHQRQASFLDNRLIQDALTLAYLIGDPAKAARLHQALAAVYNQYHQSDKALQYGQMAYAYWFITKNRAEQAKAAYSVAAAYRAMNRFEMADTFLVIAMDVFSKTGYQRQYILTMYERGVLFWQRGLFAEAEQWLNQALVEAEILGVNFHIASATHALGQVYIDLGRLDEARVKLKTVLVSWKATNHIYYQATAWCSLACLEHKAGDPDAARACIASARLLCTQIVEDSLRETLEKQIDRAESGHC